MDSDLKNSASNEQPKGEPEARPVQGIALTKSLRWTIVAYLLVLLGAASIFWLLRPGNATPELDQTFRFSVLVAYGIGVALVRKVKKTNNDFISVILMVFGGLGCGAVVFFAFILLISGGI